MTAVAPAPDPPALPVYCPAFPAWRPVRLTVNSTHNFGSYSPFTVSGNFSLNSSGSFTAPSGTASFGSNFTLKSNSTFSANGGTVNFNGGTAALSCGNKTFNRVTFTNASGTKTVGTNCSLPLGSNPNANSGGSISLNGTLSGSGTLTTAGTLTLGGAGSLSGLTGLATNALTVNGSYDFGSYSPFTVNGNFTLGGSLTAPSGSSTFAGNFTNNGSFAANGGTMSVAGNFANSGTFNRQRRHGGAERLRPDPFRQYGLL